MSRVYFHTKTKDAEIGGAERHWWGALCRRVSDGFLDITSGFCDDRINHIRKFVAPGHYLHRYADARQFADHFTTAFHVGYGDALLVYKGKPIEPLILQLNTALTFGGDALKLAARLHGSCEIHCWVEQENRAWLADMIERAVSVDVFRKSHPGSNHVGYENAVSLLRHPEHVGPVVCSYSVCEQFPGVHLLKPDNAGDDWYEKAYDIPKDERWDRSMTALRETDGGLELKPENWDEFRFGHRLSVLDLMAHDAEARLDEAIADGRL